MKQKYPEREEFELARLVYHDDKRAINAFRKRLSDDADQDQLGALVADQHYVVQLNWDSPDYATILSDIRKLKQCSGLAVNWKELRKLAVWLGEQEREAGDYWSISFVKMVASVLGRHGLDVLLIRDGDDPDWAAMAFPSDRNARRAGDLLSLDDSVDVRWTMASEAGWDSPKAVTREIQRRLATRVDPG
jgi:hypothetical protein